MRVLAIFAVVVALLAAGRDIRAQTESDAWSFTAAEIEIAYRYQERFGERIPRPLRARECMLGQKEFIASRNAIEFVAPCRFIAETIRHIKEMIEAGAARYLFPLDADHAHLAVPLELWENRYSKLPPEKLLPALLLEPTLAALYHTAEHLGVVDSPAVQLDPTTRSWKEKRNVLGSYDGRPIKILTPDPRGIGVSVPRPYYSLAGFNFLASPRGELNIFLPKRAITFDITFDTGTVENESSRAQLRPPNAGGKFLSVRK
jgi:hypothetical protein